MWPIGSSPAVEGTAPERRTHVAAARGAYPITGPPTRRRLCSPPRVSIHITQSETGSPAASTGTVLAHCPVTLTAATRSAVTSDPASARRVASLTMSHHSPASCTAPPSPSRRVLRATWSCQAILPTSDTRPTLSPPVPRSTARTKRCVAPGPGRSRHPPSSGGRASCLSIMSAMTARMSSSASSLVPPATPP